MLGLFEVEMPVRVLRKVSGSQSVGAANAKAHTHGRDYGIETLPSFKFKAANVSGC